MKRAQISLRLNKDLLDKILEIAKSKNVTTTTAIRELIILGLESLKRPPIESITLSKNIVRWLFDEIVKHQISPPTDIFVEEVRGYFLWKFGKSLEEVDRELLKREFKGILEVVFGAVNVQFEARLDKMVMRADFPFPSIATVAHELIRDFLESTIKCRVIESRVVGNRVIFVLQ
ncbi:MAG: hypothetical protein ACTSXJ_09115 [Candidatus Baldrarchaeia archaeon]